MKELKLLRLLAGWSQAELAHRLGIHGSRLSLIERGLVQPSAQESRKILHHLRTFSRESALGTCDDDTVRGECEDSQISTT